MRGSAGAASVNVRPQAIRTARNLATIATLAFATDVQTYALASTGQFFPSGRHVLDIKELAQADAPLPAIREFQQHAPVIVERGKVALERYRLELQRDRLTEPIRS